LEELVEHLGLMAHYGCIVGSLNEEQICPG